MSTFLDIDEASLRFVLGAENARANLIAVANAAQRRARFAAEPNASVSARLEAHWTRPIAWRSVARLVALSSALEVVACVCARFCARCTRL